MRTLVIASACALVLSTVGPARTERPDVAEGERRPPVTVIIYDEAEAPPSDTNGINYVSFRYDGISLKGIDGDIFKKSDLAGFVKNTKSEKKVKTFVLVLGQPKDVSSLDVTRLLHSASAGLKSDESLRVYLQIKGLKD